MAGFAADVPAGRSDHYIYPMKKVWPLLLLLASCGKEEFSLSSFREMRLPVTGDLSAVCFSDSLHGVISGGKAWESGFLLSTANGGDSWTLDTTLNRKMEHVTFSPSGQGYACGQDLMFLRTPGATHWEQMRQDFQWLRCAHFPDDKHGAAVSGEGYHGGQTRVFGPDVFWQLDTIQYFQGELEAVWFADASTIIAVGTGWVIRSEDAGQSWERLRLSDDFFTSVHFPDAKTGYICGNSGSILKSTDGGKNWEALRKGGTTGLRHKGFRAIWFENPERGWLVGDQGIFWQTTDGGKHWKQVKEAPEDVDYTDVFTLNGRGWATGKDGRAFFWMLI